MSKFEKGFVLWMVGAVCGVGGLSAFMVYGTSGVHAVPLKVRANGHVYELSESPNGVDMMVGHHPHECGCEKPQGVTL